ncbi:MAG: hypothetical protein RLO08_00310 [Parvibaculaceae bacterium]
MIEVEPHCRWTGETTRMLRRAIEIDPLADISTELRHVENGRHTLFNVLQDGVIAGCFTGSLAISEKGDEFIVHAAASSDESRAITLRVLPHFERLAREALCGATRTTIYNSRLMPVLRRAGYRPFAVEMRKVL